MQFQVMKDPKGYLTDEEVEKLLNSTSSVRDYVVIRLLSRLGIRVSELIHIKVKDILFDDNQIIVSQLKKKGEFHRNAYIDKDTCEILKKYIIMHKMNKEDYILPVTRQTIFYIVRTVGKKAGINTVGSKPIHPHNFRHCIEGETIIPTNYGIITAKEAYLKESLEFDLGNGVHSKVIAKSTHNSDLIRINAGGYILKCSPIHRLFTVGKKGIEEIEAKDIKVGMYLMSSKGNFDYTVNEEQNISKEFCMALGNIIGDGCYGHTKNKNIPFFCLTDKNKEISQFYCDILNKELSHFAYNGSNIKFWIQKSGNSYNIRNNSKQVVSYLDSLLNMKHSKYREVPKFIMSASNEKIMYFLSGYYDAEGYCGRMTSASINIMIQVQMLLLKLGIISSILTRNRNVKLPNGTVINQTQYEVNVKDKEKFSKILKGVKRINLIGNKEHREEYPLQSIINELHSEHITKKDRWHGYMDKILQRNGIKYLSRYKKLSCELKTAESIMKSFIEVGENVTPIKEVIYSGFMFQKVKSLEYLKGYYEVFDFTTDSGKIVTNGIISHNSYVMRGIKKGIDIRKLQLMVGHSSFNTTAGYLNYGSKELEDEYSKMF